MRIIVLIKHVPGSADVRLERRTMAPQSESMEGTINPADRVALELALRLNEGRGGSVTALTMGAESALDSLREAMAMGADWAVWLQDTVHAERDTYLIALYLARACRRLGPCDLLLAGQRSIDAANGQVGPRVAEELGIPHLGEVYEASLLHEGWLVGRRLWRDGVLRFEVPLPALLSVPVGVLEPRYPSVAAVVDACRREITKLMPGEVSSLGGGERFTLQTRVTGAQPLEDRREGVTLRGSSQQVAADLLRRLSERGLVGGGRG